MVKNTNPLYGRDHPGRTAYTIGAILLFCVLGIPLGVYAYQNWHNWF